LNSCIRGKDEVEVKAEVKELYCIRAFVAKKMIHSCIHGKEKPQIHIIYALINCSDSW